jgi:hypothetical protein
LGVDGAELDCVIFEADADRKVRPETYDLDTFRIECNELLCNMRVAPDNRIQYFLDW